MIFFSLKQLNFALVIFFIGIIGGLFSQIISTIFLRKFQKIQIKIIFDMFLYGFLSIFYIVLNNFLNFGKLSLTPIIIFICGISTIKLLSRKTLEFFETVWYNKINKTLTQIKKQSQLKKGKQKKDAITKKS
jgi:hypothetical protein